VVTGYQGGEMNSMDGFWTVRQSDAHAWAEVWMAGRGWVRVDPTSAVAPARTGSLQRLLPPRSVIAQALGAMSPGFEVNLRAFWEATNNRWNQWVLNYSQAKQLNLLRAIGFASPSWEDLGQVLIGLIVSLSLLGAAWAQWERMRQDPWLRLLHQARHKLRQAGLALADNTPPRHMARALQALTERAVDDGLVPEGTGHAGDLQRIQAWLLRLEAWRYTTGAQATDHPRATLGTLRREFRRLRWPQPTQP
jgi:hypothetical protein